MKFNGIATAKNKFKDGDHMVQITQKEALQLNKDYNIPFGENGLFRTNSGKHKYYLAETARNMRLWHRIHDKHIHSIDRS